MLDWRIYYADGSRFDSGKGDAMAAPGFGVVCVVAPNESSGRTVLAGFDFYFWHAPSGSWWGSDLIGLVTRQAQREPTEAVSIGTTIDTARFDETMREARSDPDFPRLSGGVRANDPRRAIR